MSPLRLAISVVVAALLVTAAACASDGASDDTEARPPPTSATGAAAADCVANSSTIRRATPARDETVFLVDAQVTRLDNCADQVVWEFRANGAQLPPGYAVQYRPGPFNDFTSGDEFEPGGDAYLVVRFRNVSTVEVVGEEGDQDFETTYTGRESIAPSDLNHLQEARIVQGPEGVTQWVVGLEGERPFNVDSTTDPPRVVLTIG